MSKAPSEKHLQDYIHQHPEILGQVEGRYEDEYYLDYEIFAREARLPSGRADFLAKTLHEISYSLCAIETKKDAVTSKCLAQCLRYMRDLREIWNYAISGLPEPEYGQYSYATEPKVTGLLIGSSVGEDVLISAWGAKVQVGIYTFDGNNYSIEFPDFKSPRDEYLDYAYGYVGETTREIYMEYLNLVYKPDAIEQMQCGYSLDEKRQLFASKGII